jgi:uncharacterized membrane protein YozB (DUF420 family)
MTDRFSLLVMQTMLPTINAALNGTCACLLLTGFWLIRKGNKETHAKVMAAAFGVSVLFLISYLTHHALHGSTRFTGTGWVRPVYFAILISHTLLAAVIVPLVLRTIYLAFKRRDAEHRAIARWTLPLWLYVSVTGVVVYWMLYQL